MTRPLKTTPKTASRVLFLRKRGHFTLKKGKKTSKTPPAVDYRGIFFKKNFTGKEADPETGLYYYGARYLDPKTSRWISGDPALGEYLPVAPLGDEERKRNQSLPGMGGVFNYVNLHVYHYAGNNPVRYVDPDGRITIDDDNKIIYADLTDVKDLDKAFEEWMRKSGDGWNVVASDKDNTFSMTFDKPLKLLAYIGEVDSNPIVPSGSTLKIGVGERLIVVFGAGLEGGLTYSAENGYGFYLSGGLGYGFGASTTITGNINVTPDTDLHGETGMTATAGIGLMANFDLRRSGSFTGISGIGIGGGVLHTKTITARGLLKDFKSLREKLFGQ